MSSGPLPYGRQTIDGSDVRAVTDCLASDWLTQGPAVEAFERALCQRTGASDAVAVNSGTAALHLAYLGLGVGPGDVGIVPAVTFVATANAFLYAGASVRFVDVDPDTGLLSVEALATEIELARSKSQRIAVVAPVHLNGQPADMQAIGQLAAAAGARVVEDAAHALGAEYAVSGETFRVGGCAHADAAILSFHPVKHITTGEGGAVLTNDADIAGRVRKLRSHGIHKDPKRFERSIDGPWAGPWYYELDELGYNYRITDLQCALGCSQLTRIDAFLGRRAALAARYDAAFSSAPCTNLIAPVPTLPHRRHAYHLYVVRLLRRPGEALEAVAARRKGLYGFLAEQSIQCQVHYVPVPWQPLYRHAASRQDYPGAEAYYASCLSLPLFPRMTDDDVDRVVDAVRSWCARS